MLRRAPRNSAEVATFPGDRQAVEALTALLDAERLAGTSLASSDLPEKIASYHTSDVRELAGLLVGLSASGSRSAGFVLGDDLALVLPELSNAARDHLPLLIHHASKKDGGLSGASHDAFVAMRDSGCAMFFCADAQEAVDMTLVARRVAEQALVPCISSQDSFAGSDELFTLQKLEPVFIDQFIGKAQRIGPSPT